ncbi:uncharacterized protein LOC111783056 isoform X1 [Cucurbita pepo subsp. pepo]|uniref:uncharacterized protein LOC111783056 isoform X1 n=2 Tax=Cucurbita pepo subsp. pepo TaxID=3664 RepID=UPI000C9D9C37|nr:uncharacterized protein LOC111783056 isoform X1 [Cucurbita pepo subsp. pepo]
MEATTCFHWSQPFIPHCPSSPQTLASTVLSPSSSKRRNYVDGGSLVGRCVQRLEQSNLFGSSSTKLHRSRSCEISKPKSRSMKRTCSASLDAFSDEEFSKKIQELTLRFQCSADENETGGSNSASCAESDSVMEFVEPSWPETGHERPDWPGHDELFPAMIERRANNFDLPVSLRMLKKKLQWREEIRESAGSSQCSVKKAFSSVVFMIRELHCYTLRLREILYFEDLQSILVRVQKETHASFVWLFQQVFSQTPALMVSIMILLANFTVYSIGNNEAFAYTSPPPTAMVSVVESHDQHHSKFDSSTISTFSVSSSSGKTTSIGGNNGGGGKVRPTAGGVDDDGQFDQSDQYRTILPDNASQVSSFGTAKEAESVSNIEDEEEASLWNSVVEEASKMRQWRDEVLDRDAMRNLMSPVMANIETDYYTEYLRTELLYQTSLFQDPNNPLLLTNYAQFLNLVAHDYDRAEEYFKRAVAVEPPEAEAFDKYAAFLWQVRNDLWAAEETFLEAMSADPGNSYYAANYAHFLWNTGGDDTCFPLDSPEA